MTVRIRFKGGPRAGELLEFDDASEAVLIGRDPARCQVVLADERVSREHCLLRRSLGGWTLEIQRGNVVLLAGRAAHDRQLLDGLCELQLGRGGPTLLVHADVGGELPPTAGAAAPRAGTHTLIDRLRHGERRLVVGLSLTVVGLGLASTWGWAALTEVSDRVEITRGEVRTMTASEKAELMEAIDGLALSVEERGRLDLIAAEKAPSVGVVMLGRSGQAPDLAQPLATAWVGREDAFVSNAHVAEDFIWKGPDQTMFVRGLGDHPVDVPITSIKLHPGYRSFARLRDRYSPSGPEQQGELGFAPAADVALLIASPEQIVELGPPLALASTESLVRLAAGDPVLTIGYPREGLVHGGGDSTRPKPENDFGYVTSTTDFFFGASLHAEDELLVHDSLSTARGASGSPIFDRQGNVVAVRSAGNFLRVPSPAAAKDITTGVGGGEMLVPVGVANFSQRADFVRELLDGTADEKQRQRDAAWEGEFQRLATRGADWLIDCERQAFLDRLRREGFATQEVEEVWRTTENLAGRGETNGRRLALSVPRSGRCCAIAVPKRAVDLNGSAIEDGTPLARDLDANHRVLLQFAVRDGRPVDVFVWSATDEDPVEFLFVVLRDKL